jgi:translation initiation factor IF-3
MQTTEALKLAQQKGADLIVIAENAVPPVAKILDFNKFLYDEKKKEAQTKAKSKKSELKELWFGPAIDEGDLRNKANRAGEFLKDGHRVRLTVNMRGREQAYPEIGISKIRWIEKELEAFAKLEKQPEIKGNKIHAVLIKA